MATTSSLSLKTPSSGQVITHPDILRNILNHCDQSTLAIALSVNRSFFAVAGSILYRVINLDPYSRYTLADVFLGAAREGGNFKLDLLKFVKKLFLDSFHPLCDDPDIDAACLHMPRLLALRFAIQDLNKYCPSDRLCPLTLLRSQRVTIRYPECWHSWEQLLPFVTLQREAAFVTLVVECGLPSLYNRLHLVRPLAPSGADVEHLKKTRILFESTWYDKSFGHHVIPAEEEFWDRVTDSIVSLMKGGSQIFHLARLDVEVELRSASTRKTLYCTSFRELTERLKNALKLEGIEAGTATPIGSRAEYLQLPDIKDDLGVGGVKNRRAHETNWRRRCERNGAEHP
ncbi:hypothetical protein EHS25_008760 [Saitozyma podzolica]|uniref:F-box domain-containing protein n=1 Tax=Saitozyma podzolica TaxID=1890683 RepID=A0A427YMM7_9TREE|nr:hypothetical protein EHS25_008760 [Saitozyma podzolica]